MRGSQQQSHSPLAVVRRKGRISRSTAVWNIFHRNSPPEQQVTTGRFEIEQDGQTAYLDYSLTGNILELIHTEVPPALRHLGLASALAENALQWARERGLKVDIVCPTVRRYIDQHPEYRDLEMH
jgi:predicted GNAT family acetyltransferase